MKKLLAALLTLTLFTCLFASALAYPDAPYSIQYAFATDKLALRSGPTTHSESLGTYQMAGEYIQVSSRFWDDTNTIWWLEVSFYYKGKPVTGWTGEQRFDPASYDLYALPVFNGNGGGHSGDYSYGGDYGSDYSYGGDYSTAAPGYRAQYALAADKLSLRSGPTTHSEDLGTYKMAGAYVYVSSRHWDDTNSIWWLEVTFDYKGRSVTGWTGEQRFDPASYDLYALPIF